MSKGDRDYQVGEYVLFVSRGMIVEKKEDKYLIEHEDAWRRLQLVEGKNIIMVRDIKHEENLA